MAKDIKQIEHVAVHRNWMKNATVIGNIAITPVHRETDRTYPLYGGARTTIFTIA
jgi:hypothetical protein